MKILMVEDDEFSREGFTRFLTLKGHRVVEASNGEQAVTAASRETFDIVFLDVKMPKLDGISACQLIHTTQPDAKILLMTGYRVDDDMQRRVEGKVTGWLQKPVTHHAIVEAIERIAANGSSTGAKAAE